MRDRVLICLPVVLALCLQGARTGRWLLRTTPSLPPTDAVSRYWQRFAAVHAQLTLESQQPGAIPWQRLGYLGDEPGDSHLPKMSHTPGTALFLAQHALLPHFLLPGEADRMLANFHDPAAAAAALRRPGLSVERDFGDGVLLVRRQP